MQAIARVNRVYQDKEGGLVFDFVGIASALKQAMKEYTTRDQDNFGQQDILQAAYPRFLEKLQVCKDLFHGFDYSSFETGSDLEKGKLISEALNFMLAVDKEETKKDYLKQAFLMKQALSLCSSLATKQQRMDAAFFEAVRVLLCRFEMQGGGGKISLDELNKRINELLEQSIKSDGVINLFSDVKQEFSIFDPKFLEELAKMKQKNLAIELLKKLIAEQVMMYQRMNLVQSEKFSEIMKRVMNSYLNGMLTNEEVIQELLNLAKQIQAAQAQGENLGLNAEEMAFYDAITKPENIKDFYENETLVALTRELTETLRRNRTIDWEKRETARAKMRMMVKRLLKQYNYPPEGMEAALQTVMAQCELWADNPLTNI